MACKLWAAPLSAAINACTALLAPEIVLAARAQPLEQGVMWMHGPAVPDLDLL